MFTHQIGYKYAIEHLCLHYPNRFTASLEWLVYNKECMKFGR